MLRRRKCSGAELTSASNSQLKTLGFEQLLLCSGMTTLYQDHGGFTGVKSRLPKTRTFSLADLIAGYLHTGFRCPFHFFFPSLHYVTCPHLLAGFHLTHVQASPLIVLRKSQHLKESLLGADGYSTGWDRSRNPEVLNSFLDDESASVLNKRDSFIPGVHLSPSPAICGKVEANV